MEVKAYPKAISEPQPRGTWKEWHGRVTLCCPRCGALASLGDHTIGADGMVTPSVECFIQGCKFHEDLRLADWAQGPAQLPGSKA